MRGGIPPIFFAHKIRPLGYERVCLTLYKVRYTLSYPRGRIASHGWAGGRRQITNVTFGALNSQFLIFRIT